MKKIHFYKMFWNYTKKLVIQSGKEISESLKQYAPLKTKVICGKHKPFITKNLRKEIVKRPALKKRSNILNNLEMIKLYRKQRNYVVNFSRKARTAYFKKHMQHHASSKNF